MGKPAELGTIEVHYLRPDLLGIAGPPNARIDGTATHTNHRVPAIPIEPQENG